MISVAGPRDEWVSAFRSFEVEGVRDIGWGRKIWDECEEVLCEIWFVSKISLDGQDRSPDINVIYGVLTASC